MQKYAYPILQYGNYTLHPRIPITHRGVGSLGDDDDPAMEHVREAENLTWERTVDTVGRSLRIEEVTEIAYIENPEVEERFKVSLCN